jgi:maleamate amidohydrolase
VNPPALLVIDMQRDFLASWEGSARDRLVTSVQELVALARATVAGHPGSAGDGSGSLRCPLEVRQRKTGVVVRGTPGAQLCEGLAPAPGEPMLVKTRYSAFFRTSLDALLEELWPGALILAGVNTHACIRTTAIDAFQRDHAVVIARDCVGSWDPEHHDVSLRYLDGRIGRVLGLEQVAAELGPPRGGGPPRANA